MCELLFFALRVVVKLMLMCCPIQHLGQDIVQYDIEIRWERASLTDSSRACEIPLQTPVNRNRESCSRYTDHDSINCGGRPIAFSTKVMKDHLTVSKALEISNLTVALSEFETLWYPFTSSDARKTFSSISRTLLKAVWFGQLPHGV